MDKAAKSGPPTRARAITSLSNETKRRRVKSDASTPPPAIERRKGSTAHVEERRIAAKSSSNAALASRKMNHADTLSAAMAITKAAEGIAAESPKAAMNARMAVNSGVVVPSTGAPGL